MTHEMDSAEIGGPRGATDQGYIITLISLLLIVAIAFTLAHCEKAPVPAAQEVVGEAKEERWK